MVRGIEDLATEAIESLEENTSINTDDQYTKRLEEAGVIADQWTYEVTICDDIRGDNMLVKVTGRSQTGKTRGIILAFPLGYLLECSEGDNYPTRVLRFDSTQTGRERLQAQLDRAKLTQQNTSRPGSMLSSSPRIRSESDAQDVLADDDIDLN